MVHLRQHPRPPFRHDEKDQRLKQDAETEVLDLFERRKAGIECPLCAEGEPNDLVIRLKSGNVHLQGSGDYPGYCILVCRRHVVELHDLSKEERRDWIEDVAAIGRAISAVCSPAKLNVFMLGNMVPHLHCHVMPRYPDDAEWGKAPSFAPKKDAKLLMQEEFLRLISELRNSLRS